MPFIGIYCQLRPSPISSSSSVLHFRGFRKWIGGLSLERLDWQYGQCQRTPGTPTRTIWCWGSSVPTDSDFVNYGGKSALVLFLLYYGMSLSQMC